MKIIIVFIHGVKTSCFFLYLQFEEVILPLIMLEIEEEDTIKDDENSSYKVKER